MQAHVRTQAEKEVAKNHTVRLKRLNEQVLCSASGLGRFAAGLTCVTASVPVCDTIRMGVVSHGECAQM
jgi:hypothetical protein